MKLRNYLKELVYPKNNYREMVSLVFCMVSFMPNDAQSFLRNFAPGQCAEPIFFVYLPCEYRMRLSHDARKQCFLTSRHSPFAMFVARGAHQARPVAMGGGAGIGPAL